MILKPLSSPESATNPPQSSVHVQTSSTQSRSPGDAVPCSTPRRNLGGAAVSAVGELPTTGTPGLAAVHHGPDVDAVAFAEIIRYADVRALLEVLLAAYCGAAILGDAVVDAAPVLVQTDLGVSGHGALEERECDGYDGGVHCGETVAG
ncbi:hypothetical protein MHUMG1_07976 [Metarhizium humberi]|uniref:Uncharacterized protein n=1 Tax=Metarhizium humberi TaxID=2596975 RepID=A0A9P8S4U6_9HYPO|nr:hypothetical protein MHUMG1_07976 [Metarhizium humberi]